MPTATPDLVNLFVESDAIRLAAHKLPLKSKFVMRED